MSEPWHSERSYFEGDRVRYGGKTYRAKMDLIRGLRPVGHLSEKFWREEPTIAVSKSVSTGAGRPAAKPQRQSADLERAVDRISEIVHHSGSRSPGQYLTRDFTVESKRRHGPARK